MDFSHYWTHFFTPILEIAVIATMLNYIFSFFWNSRSLDLMLGLFAFFIIFLASSWLELPVLQHIMETFCNVAVIAILIIFQPELRMALSKFSLKGKRNRQSSEFDQFLDQLTTSIYRMSDRKIGALIAIENHDSLEDLSQKGILLQAKFSSELIESIFSHSSPLHDGAVIIRETTLLAAQVILPIVEENATLIRSMGTRHRAALSLSQICDALLIVVSEETGKVSIAREGIITRGIKIDRFKGVIRSVYPLMQKAPAPKTRFAWVRR
jgi:diadenylate cyclase